jgi:hypothetical protein
MTAHDRHRHALALLAEDEYVRGALGLDDGWRRLDGRFHFDAEPFASLTLYKRDARLLVRVFSGLRFESSALEPDVVRHHAGGRTTVRRGDAYGKTAPASALQLQRRLWAVRDRLGFAVAEPLGHEHGVLWLRAVPGEPVAFTPELARAAGAALRTLHAAPLVLDPAPDRFAAPAATLVRHLPQLRADVERLLSVPLEPGPPRPIHGAPHPPQWLHDGTRFGLIDFDRLALGDPEADVATFIEAAAAEDGGAAVASGFRAGYGPLDDQRLHAYRGRRRILKALRAATALRPDGDARAARRLTHGVVVDSV